MANPTASISPIIDAGIVIEKHSSPNVAAKKTPDASAVRVVSPSEYKEAAASIAESFRDDYVVRYPIDTPDRAHWSEAERYALHREAFEYIVYAHCLKGLVTTTGADYGCVALWMPPGQNMDDWWTVLRSGLWRLKYRLSAEGKKRFFEEFLPLLHRTKEEVLGERDAETWYLVYIGTREESRGKGCAKRLIQHVTQKLDREGRACYLESSNDINPIIYGKLGFKVVKQIYLKRAEEDLKLDIMVREPVSQRGEKTA